MTGPISLEERFDSAAYLPAGWREGYFTNLYHKQLRYGFAPGNGMPKGTIVLTHGYGEFIELYYQAIQEYQKMGYDVWAMDFYGFGKSGRDDPKNPHHPSAKGLLRHVRDLDFFVHHVVRRIPDKPMVLSTHSMGGHIGLLYLERHLHVFDAAIMSAPMFDIYRFGLPRFTRPLFRFIFRFGAAIGFGNYLVPATPLLWSKITRVSDRLVDTKRGGLREAYNEMMRHALPEARIDRPTIGWVAKAFTTIVGSTRERVLRRVKIPVLIGSAGIESLVDNDAHDRAARIMPHATLCRLPNACHAIWFENDENYALWIAAVRKFLAGLGAA